MSGKGAKGLSGKGAKGTMGDKKGDMKKKPISRSARAGLQFPVGRIHRLLKVCLHTVSLHHGSMFDARLVWLLTISDTMQSRVTANGRVGATAAVYSAAILGTPMTFAVNSYMNTCMFSCC
jgi:histone H2A